MPAALATDTAAVLHRDLCDCSIDISYLRHRLEDAADALLDAHTDLVTPEAAVKKLSDVRRDLDRIIAEAIEIAGLVAP